MSLVSRCHGIPWQLWGKQVYTMHTRSWVIGEDLALTQKHSFPHCSTVDLSVPSLMLPCRTSDWVLFWSWHCVLAAFTPAFTAGHLSHLTASKSFRWLPCICMWALNTPNCARVFTCMKARMQIHRELTSYMHPYIPMSSGFWLFIEKLY